jgi:hypothetical protein
VRGGRSVDVDAVLGIDVERRSSRRHLLVARLRKGESLLLGDLPDPRLAENLAERLRATLGLNRVP